MAELKFYSINSGNVVTYVADPYSYERNLFQSLEAVRQFIITDIAATNENEYDYSITIYRSDSNGIDVLATFNNFSMQTNTLINCIEISKDADLGRRLIRALTNADTTQITLIENNSDNLNKRKEFFIEYRIS